MASPSDILISVHARHVQSMLKGEKTVELRRRVLRITPGTRVWIYSKVPRGIVEALAIVDHVVQAPPPLIWRKFGARSAVSRIEFNDYFSELDIGCAILFNEIQCLKKNISLAEIRQRCSSFQPPQFFKTLSDGSPELFLFKSFLYK